VDVECPKCGSAMKGDPDDHVLVCDVCGYEEAEDADEEAEDADEEAEDADEEAEDADEEAEDADDLGNSRADPAADTTQNAVCTRGHALIRNVRGNGEPDESCPICGADVITGCPWCGLDFDTEVEIAEARLRCPRCERPFPWNPEARRSRWTTALKILGALAACATLIVAALHVGAFFW